MTEKTFSRLEHVGVVVRDLDKAIAYFESLGIGPFERVSAARLGALVDKTMYGKPVDFDTRAAKAHIGAIRLELVQPVKDAPLMEDFLNSRGEGMQHLGFTVGDVDKETARLVEKGHKVVFTASVPGVGKAAYLDTGEIGGVLIELSSFGSPTRGPNDPSDA